MQVNQIPNRRKASLRRPDPTHDRVLVHQRKLSNRYNLDRPSMQLLVSGKDMGAPGTGHKKKITHKNNTRQYLCKYF